MEHKVLRKAEKLQKSHTKKHWLYRGLSVLAAGAVFCTTYALILPAITLDKDAICGCEEHTHTEDCYTSAGSWNCMDDPETYEKLAQADYVAHTHDEYCYNAEGQLICPFADWDNIVEPHQHTDECYEVTTHVHDENCMELVQGELICTLEESAGHVHDESCLGEETVLVCQMTAHEHNDDCYDSKGNIVCGIEEHKHTEDCYTTEPVNVCGLEEGDGAHTHTATCYEYVTQPTCGIEEGAETVVLICEKVALHEHTDECYTDGELTCTLPVVIEHRHENCYVAGEPVLTCALEEHTHTDDCYGTYEEVPGMVGLTANSSGDLSNNALYWISRLPAVTGHWAYDLVEVAQSQVGYTENAYTQYIIYGDWSEQWDQTFVSWCLRKAEIDKDVIPQENTVIDFINAANEKGILHEGVYVAEAGDIVVYYTEDGNVLVGIVYYNEGTETYGAIGVQDGVVTNALDWNFKDIVAWVCVNDLDPNQTSTEEPSEEEYLLDEDKWDPVAWQKLVDSGWFEYWEYYPELYDEETTTTATVDSTVESTTGTESASQIKYKGDTTEGDKVTVSKTAEGTDSENVFDITLTVTTQEDIQKITTDPDMAVVIVMDISNTMRDTFSGANTKVDAAITAAENFVDQFAEATANTSLSQIGFVAFNSNAYEICEMRRNVNTESSVAKYKNDIRTGVESYTNANGYDVSHYRFTNMEAGLQRAQDMLAAVNNKNKFIVFLTDGLPTTYLENRQTYQGYDTYTESGAMDTDGVFADVVRNIYCGLGTNYSDKGAERTQQVATSIKASNVKIYSVGVGLSTFSPGDNSNGWNHIKYCLNMMVEGYSLIDRGNVQMEQLVIYDPDYTDGDDYFEHWLKNDIGSGFFENCENADRLKEVFSNVFQEIQTVVQKNMTEAWTVTDPIPADQFEYIGKVSETNVGEFDVPDTDNANTIHWDLKTATPTTTGGDGSYTYTYQVTYRVRLKNEAGESVFTENEVYNTNGTTTLKYRVIQETSSGGSTSSSYKDGTIDFPIPSVHGYLGDLTFTKVSRYSDSETGTPLSGAKFTLTHYENCELCKLTEKSQEYWSTVESMNQKDHTSDQYGKVTFTGIPSGHTYILEETETPSGHQPLRTTYLVDVEYDRVTVKANGEVVWKDVSTEEFQYPEYFTLPNYTSPELPSTGGNGTRRYILIGVLLMSTAVLLYTVRRRQRE